MWLLDDFRGPLKEVGKEERVYSRGPRKIPLFSAFGCGWPAFYIFSMALGSWQAVSSYIELEVIQSKAL